MLDIKPRMWCMLSNDYCLWVAPSFLGIEFCIDINIKSKISVGYDKCMTDFTINCQTVFQSQCTILHSHQKSMRFPASLHPSSTRYYHFLSCLLSRCLRDGSLWCFLCICLVGFGALRQGLTTYPDWLWILNLPAPIFQVLGLQVYASEFWTFTVVLIYTYQMIKDIYQLLVCFIDIHFMNEWRTFKTFVCFKLMYLHSGWVVMINSDLCAGAIFFQTYMCKYFPNLLSAF